MTGFDCSLHGKKREKRQLNKKKLQPLSVKNIRNRNQYNIVIYPHSLFGKKLVKALYKHLTIAHLKDNS